jgi:photosystem II stability/assembly factor-like uncharacterized protein
MGVRRTSVVPVGLLVLVLGGAVKAGAQPAAWESLALGPPAVEAPVGFCPGDHRLLYIGTFGGGVLASRDDGRTFTAVNGGLSNLAVAAMAVDPVHCDTVYVATFGAGLFKTTDGGASWSSLGEAATLTLWLAIDPVRPWILYSGINGGAVLRKTTDGGRTWQNASSGLPVTSVWSIQIDRGNPDVLYAGTGGSGAYKSTDGGASWTRMPVGPIVWSVAIDPSDSQVIYAGTNGDGVFRSLDAGASFHRVGVPGNGRVLSLALDPHRRGVIYAGLAGGGVAVSTDFGQSFTDTALTGNLAIVLSMRETGEVYVGTGSEGVLASHSYGAVWKAVAADELRVIRAQNVYALAIAAARPARLIAATNDGGILASPDKGATWSRLGSGFSSRAARAISFDPVDSNRLYTGSFNGGGLQVSDDGGLTWTSRPVGSPVSYIWATAVDARTRAVFAGTVGEGLWRSTDLGLTFTRLGGTTISDVRAVAADGSRILGGGRLGLYRSVDGGATWTQPLTGFVSSITVDPRNPDIVYVAGQTTGVLRSTDGGVTFKEINTGLTTLRTSRGAGVVIDPRTSATLYVATEGGGVFKSIDGGESWRPVNQGLSNLTVFALAIDPQDPGVLYAGGGSGVFKTTTGGEPR